MTSVLSGRLYSVWTIKSDLLHLACEETHFHTRQLQDIIICKLAGLRANRLTINQRIITFFSAFNVDDVITLGTSRDCSDLYARTTKRRERFRQFQFATGKRTTQYLKFGHWQCAWCIAWINTG